MGYSLNISVISVLLNLMLDAGEYSLRNKRYAQSKISELIDDGMMLLTKY